ncbi:MAG: hypothetical protein L0312_16675 [Acidobacteria bacterium]|nr:hypothetical protein [Acidobacteriota bacterium]
MDADSADERQSKPGTLPMMAGAFWVPRQSRRFEPTTGVNRWAKLPLRSSGCRQRAYSTLATAAGVGTGQLLQPLAYTSGLAKGSDSDFDGTLGAFCGLKSTLELHTGVSHTTAAALRQMKKII